MTTYYIKADKFFYPYEVKVGCFLEVTADGKFGKHTMQALKRDSAQAVSNGALVAPELVRRKEAWSVAGGGSFAL